MDLKIKKIILAGLDLVVAAFLIYLILFHKPTIVISYDLQQLIAISGASGAGITFLYWKRLRKHNPKVVKSLELLLYLVAPTVASIPLLAKVSYYLISVVCFLVPIGWFIFALIKIGTPDQEEEKKMNKETMITLGIMFGMLLAFLVTITWFITIICAYQCKNP